MNGSRVFRRAAALLVAGVAVIALPAPGRVRAGGLIHEGPAPDLTLLYTGDVIGFVDPCG